MEKVHVGKVLSYLSFALGVTEKPGPFVALSVGNRSLKLVEVMAREGRRELLGYWVKEISVKEGLSEKQKQKVIQKHAITFLKSSPISSIKIHLGFGEELLPVRRVTVPEMPKEELPQALRWAVRTQLPFDAEGALLAFEVLSTLAKKQEALVVMGREELLSDWVLTMQEVGFRIASITSNPLSLIAWMRQGGLFSGPDPIALLDIGTFRASLYILVGGKISFIRDLEIGGETITQALTRPLATEKGELRLGQEEAERLKRTHGFPLDWQFQAGEINAPQMVSLMRPLLERLANEVKRSFDYHEETFGGRVQKMVLLGGSSQLIHLSNFLSEKLLRSVEMLPLPSGFHWDPPRIDEKGLKTHLPLLAPALGLAFQEGKGLDLLPGRFHVQKSQKIERISMRIASIVIGFILVILFAYQRTQLNLLKKEYELSKSSWRVIEEIASMQKALAEQRQILSKIKEGHPFLLEGLAEIADLLPSYVVLSRISNPRGTNTLSFSGTIFGLEDRPTEGLLGEMISRFEKSPFFTEVKLVSSQRDETFDRPASNFEISCRLRMR